MRGRSYEPYEVDYIIANYQHMTANELGLQLNRTRSAIQTLIIQLRKSGRLERDYKCYSLNEMEYIKEHIGHESITEIAEHLGKTAAAVSIKIYKMRKQGQLKGSTYKPYTQSELSYIAKQYGFLSAKEIAAELGRTPKAIEQTVVRLRENEKFEYYRSEV
jgi:biotin operon repressor